MNMNPNVGPIDRIVRIIGGVALIAFALGYIAPGNAYAWLGWFGVVPILTAVFGICPAYKMLGMSTCPMHAKKG